MNVIMHYPKTEQGMKELQQRIAQVHAGAVINYINQLAYPKAQKLEIFNSVQKEIKRKMPFN